MPSVLFALVVMVASLDALVGLAAFPFVIWFGFNQRFEPKVDAALARRRIKFQDEGKPPDEVAELVKPLQSTWTLLDWFFWASGLSFIGLLVVDFSSVQFCGVSNFFNPLLSCYGFLFLGLGLFEGWHARRLVNDDTYTPKLYFVHLALWPLVALLQAAAGYALYLEVSLLSPTVSFTLFGWALFITLVLSFCAAASIFWSTRKPNWDLSFRVRIGAFAVVLAWVSPWLVLIIERLLSQPLPLC